MILRVDHKKDYTVLSNRMLRDKALTFRARGLLAFILTLPDGSQVESARLAANAPEGRDAVRTALTELEKSHYLRREKEQAPDGTWRTVCLISEVPSKHSETDAWKSGAGDWKSAPTSHQPTPGNPTVGFPGGSSSITDEQVLNAVGADYPPVQPAAWTPTGDTTPATPQEKATGKSGADRARLALKAAKKATVW